VFNVWNLKGYFDTIPIDLEEAATIDGATPTQAFWMVMLPLARPAIAVTALFGFLAGFGDFIIAQTVLFDPNKYTATVGIFTLQEGYRTPWGWFAACALIISVPITLLFLYLQRNLVGGLSAGGVKG
jgi:arabinogalactan oligomer/maltooligosaccharide transport system permease protein